MFRVPKFLYAPKIQLHQQRNGKKSGKRMIIEVKGIKDFGGGTCHPFIQDLLQVPEVHIYRAEDADLGPGSRSP